MLDIKLKNNKKIGVLIAVIITALFSACFMALYPTFEKKADMYYKDSLLREDFLGYLYRGNCIKTLGKKRMEQTIITKICTWK